MATNTVISTNSYGALLEAIVQSTMPRVRRLTLETAPDTRSILQGCKVQDCDVGAPCGRRHRSPACEYRWAGLPRKSRNPVYRPLLSCRDQFLSNVTNFNSDWRSTYCAVSMRTTCSTETVYVATFKRQLQNILRIDSVLFM